MAVAGRRRSTRLRAADAWEGRSRLDDLAVEEPLEIRIVDGRGVAVPYAVVMRTPGHDVDLALGFCIGEGLVGGSADVARAGLCTTGVVGVGRAPDLVAEQRSGESAVEVVLAAGVSLPDDGAARRTVSTSACGVCGTPTVDAAMARARHEVHSDPVTVDAAVLADLPGRLRAGQRLFDRTGGTHAAGLFDATGGLVCLREDVGRHNAVDKVVGHAFQRGLLPLTGHILQVSGRVSFEIVQKAAAAGIPVVAAVSAPTSLAVDLAAGAGLTLVAFSRGDRLTVFAGGERITSARDAR